MRTSAVAAIVLLAWLARPAAAQQPQPDANSAQPPPAVDVSKLPINVGRLQRRLTESALHEERNGPVLRFNIDVLAQAPRIVLVTPDDNLRFGKPRKAAPSHQDMMNLATPQEFRSPVMNLNNLFNWIVATPKEK